MQATRGSAQVARAPEKETLMANTMRLMEKTILSLDFA